MREKKKNAKSMKWNVDAYFTVEAACLIPFVTVIVAAFIFVGFYIYDRCILEQCAYEAALRGSGECYVSNEDAHKVVVSAAQELVSQRLLAVGEVTSEVKVTALSIQVTYQVRVAMPFTVIGDVMTICVTKEVPRLKPVTTIRTFRKINEKMR